MAHSYRTRTGARLSGMTLVTHPVLGLAAAAPAADAVDAEQAALDLTALAQNPNPTAGGDGMFVVTTDNTELSFWPIDTRNGYLALPSGLLVRALDGGHQLDRGVAIHAPLEVDERHMALDQQRLEAAHDVFSREASTEAA